LNPISTFHTLVSGNAKGTFGKSTGSTAGLIPPPLNPFEIDAYIIESSLIK
jgi:hypothetical protein